MSKSCEEEHEQAREQNNKGGGPNKVTTGKNACMCVGAVQQRVETEWRPRPDQSREHWWPQRREQKPALGTATRPQDILLQPVLLSAASVATTDLASHGAWLCPSNDRKRIRGWAKAKKGKERRQTFCLNNWIRLLNACQQCWESLAVSGVGGNVPPSERWKLGNHKQFICLVSDIQNGSRGTSDHPFQQQTHWSCGHK